MECPILVEPWHRLRAEIGLPPTSENPLFEGQHAPTLVLAMFSKVFAAKQSDWPNQTVITGFPFYDQDGEAGLSPELLRFLDSGPAPIVFTLGSSAVMDAGNFYEDSAAAAKILSRRAVLLVGKDPRNRPPSLPEGVVAFDYAPFSEIFPRAAAIVHQGGIGTTAQAMRSGRPMLVMPYAHDQPDNADRLVRLGIARSISRHRYTPDRAAAELRHLLDNPAYSERAVQVGKQVGRRMGFGRLVMPWNHSWCLVRPLLALEPTAIYTRRLTLPTPRYRPGRNPAAVLGTFLVAAMRFP